MAGDHIPHAAPIRLQAIRQTDIPKGRQGKYEKIVEKILHRLDGLAPGAALKLALASLPASKAEIRAALNRATHKEGLSVATSSDAKHLYIWKATGKP